MFTDYFSGLDWPYILTFIILAHFFNRQPVKDRLFRYTGICTRTRYRTILVGMVTAIAMYFLRGQDLLDIERLFHSLIFALVFHKMILDRLLINLVSRKTTSFSDQYTFPDDEDKNENE